MIISRVETRNFRCLRETRVDCERLTELIGANGTGKSSVIRAIEFFFGQLDVDDLDCHNGERGLTIEVSLTFCGLPDSLTEAAKVYLDAEGCLRVTKRSAPGNGARGSSFVANRLKCADFESLRGASTATEAKAVYEGLRADERFEDLPAWKSREQTMAALGEWEGSHPEGLTPMEDSSVGYGAGRVDLRSYVRPIFVRAVWEAADEAAEARTGAFGEIVSLLVAPHLETLTSELRRLEESAAGRYRSLIEEHGNPALRKAEEILTQRLSALVPNAAIKLDWESRPPSIGGPKVHARLAEAGFVTEIGRQGHGTQRAYLLALLQELDELRRAATGSSDSATQPLLLLAIEEPELYQHPVQARLLARVLSELAQSREPGAVQVIYATHSPFFVSLDNVESLRLFRLSSENGPPSTEIAQVDLAAVAHALWEASGSHGPPFTPETMKARLRLLTESPVSEGFFARAVVLVEGDEDWPIIKATAAEQGVDLDQMGIVVLPVDGKSNLDRPYLVFKQLGIPVFVIFDGDANKGRDRRDTDSNKRLLTLLASEAMDLPETQVQATWACFKNDIKTTLREEIGASEFDTALREARGELGFTRGGEKNPIVLAVVLAKLRAAGHASETLSKVVTKIKALVPVARDSRPA
jgi:hypothetical protein